jgi:hypothetical protein
MPTGLGVVLALMALCYVSLMALLLRLFSGPVGLLDMKA